MWYLFANEPFVSAFHFAAGFSANAGGSSTSNVQSATSVLLSAASTARSCILYPLRTFLGVPVISPVFTSTENPNGSLSAGEAVSAPSLHDILMLKLPHPSVAQLDCDSRM